MGGAGKALVPVAASERILREMVDAAASNDTLRYRAARLAGSALVAGGTEARVVDVAYSRIRVRLTEGQHFGWTGWIVHRWAGCR